MNLNPEADPLEVFTSSQRENLERRLREVVPPENLEDALFVIGMAVRDGAIVVSHKPELDAAHAADAGHFSELLECALRLRELIAAKPPRIGLASRFAAQFDRVLGILIQSTQEHVGVATGHIQPGRGRRPTEWRDRLIATVYHVYPPGKAARTVESHFEETVGMLLRLLDPIDNKESLHKVVRDAFKRNPEYYDWRALSNSQPAKSLEKTHEGGNSGQ